MDKKIILILNNSYLDEENILKLKKNFQLSKKKLVHRKNLLNFW